MPDPPAFPRLSIYNSLKQDALDLPAPTLTDLNAELRRSADVYYPGPDGLVQAVSPAGTTERLPIASAVPVPVSDVNLSQRVPVEPTVSPTPRTGFFTQLRPGSSGISRFFSNTAVQEGLGQFALAFSGNREGSAGTVLGRAAIGMAQRSAENSYMRRLLAGEDPAKISGPDVAALTPEGRQRAMGVALQQREDARRERDITLKEQQEKRIASQEGYRLLLATEQTLNDTTRLRIQQWKTKFDAYLDVKQYNFAVSKEEFAQTRALIAEDLQQDIFDLREKVAEASMEVDRERAKLMRRTDPNLRSGTNAEGQEAMNLLRTQSILEGARESYEEQRALIREAEAQVTMLKNAAGWSVNQAEQNAIDAAQTIVDTLTGQLPQVEEEIKAARKKYREALGLTNGSPSSTTEEETGGDTGEAAPDSARTKTQPTAAADTLTTAQTSALNDVSRLVTAPNSTADQLTAAYAKAKNAGVKFTPEQAAAIEAKIREKL